MSAQWQVISALMVILAAWSWRLKAHPDASVANGLMYAERVVSTSFLVGCFLWFALGLFGTKTVYSRDNLYPLAEESQTAGRQIYVAESIQSNSPSFGNEDDGSLIQYRDTEAGIAPDRVETSRGFMLVQSCSTKPYMTRTSYSSNFNWMRKLDKNLIQVQTTLCIPPNSVVISNNISLPKSYATAHP